MSSVISTSAEGVVAVLGLRFDTSLMSALLRILLISLAMRSKVDPAGLFGASSTGDGGGNSGRGFSLEYMRLCVLALLLVLGRVGWLWVELRFEELLAVDAKETAESNFLLLPSISTSAELNDATVGDVSVTWSLLPIS